MNPDLRNRFRHAGFSLVEVMVGITVGLVTVLIITQTMSLFQGGRNTIVGGTSAQENGLFAMQLAATDIRSTGAGYYSTATANAASLQSCTNVCSFYGSGKGGCSNAGTPTGGSPMASISGKAYTGGGYTLKAPLFPVIIEPSGSGISGGIQYGAGSDIITVRSASRFIGAIPAALTAPDSNIAAGSNLSVGRTFGFATGDLALIADGGGNCTVIEVTAVDADTRALSHAAGTSFKFNPSEGFVWPAGEGGKAFGTTSMVYGLGNNVTTPDAQGVRAPGVVVAREYSISGNGTAMQMRQYGALSPNDTTNPAAILPMADGIVALKAQYGIAASVDSPSVASWVGTDSDTWKPDKLTAANARLIRAIRILVVARAGNREASEVTAACGSEGFVSGPCPSGGATETDLTLPAINLSGLQWAAADEWKHYRYKTYLTVVPIRNILWNGSWSL